MRNHNASASERAAHARQGKTEEKHDDDIYLPSS